MRAGKRNMIPERALPRTVLVTGASGLVGTAVIEELLRRDTALRVFALVRRPAAAAMLLARLGPDAARVSTLTGDIRAEGLGLDAGTRAHLRGRVRSIVHAAADTALSRPLEDARAVNTRGTGHLLELTGEWGVERLVHISTAYVAGRRTGPVAERSLSDSAGFVNGFEQSRYEAEELVRDSGSEWVILRPSTIMCDDARGGVSQYNAVHRALRVFHAGLGSMIPGSADTPVDMVTRTHVVDGVLDIGLAPDTAGGTYHLCAGTGAIPLGEMLDVAHRIWSRDTAWRRRGIVMPALTDPGTYRLFEEAVAATGDVRLGTITRSLSHFVPQLTAPKLFDTRLADAVLARSAPPVTTFWRAIVEYLVDTRWGAGKSAA